MFQCETSRHQGLSFTPFIVLSFHLEKNADFSFQLLILTCIHVNSLFKFIINDQETIWGSFDWAVSKWPLLYVMGFRVFFADQCSNFFIPFSISIAWFEMNLSSGIVGDIKTCSSTLIESMNTYITLSQLTRQSGRVRLPYIDTLCLLKLIFLTDKQ